MKTQTTNKEQTLERSSNNQEKHTMKTNKTLFGIVGIALALMAGHVQAAVVVTDDFNRANGALGANWTTITAGTGNWTIISNQAVNSTGANAVGLDQYTGSGFLAGTGAYDVQANLFTPAGTGSGSSVGVAFNIIDVNNYYAVRVQRSGGFFQFIQVVGGTVGQVSTGNSTFAGTGDLMKVSHSTSQADGVYTLTINAGTFTLTDSTSPLTGGGLGLYYAGSSAPGGGLKFDNFSATGVPEPAAASLLTVAGMAIMLRRRIRQSKCG